MLVVSCLDSTSATIRSRLNFINPIAFTSDEGPTVPAGAVVKQITTRINGAAAAPSNGWAHVVHRPDKGDLLGCGSDGSLYSIDYSQTNSVTDGTATLLSTPAFGSLRRSGLGRRKRDDLPGCPHHREQDRHRGALQARRRKPDATFTTSLSCPANGLAISGGVVLVSCAGLENTTPIIQRLDKNTGGSLGLYPSISLPVPGSTVQGFLGLTALPIPDPGLGDLACDPVTFEKNPAGRDGGTSTGMRCGRGAEPTATG